MRAIHYVIGFSAGALFMWWWLDELPENPAAGWKIEEDS